MTHKHSVYDTGEHFIINPITRMIKFAGDTKPALVQFDHRSERFTFEIPRYVDGHDMSLCNVVQVHYLNIATNKVDKMEDAYEVDDLQISPASQSVVICSWLISRNATNLAGSLNFMLRFACISEEGLVEYSWNTATFAGISILGGMDHIGTVEEEVHDFLATMNARIEKVEEHLGEHEHDYLTLDGETIILKGDDLTPQSRTLTICADTSDAHVVKIDTSDFELRMNELAGRWVIIDEQRIYIGFNTADTLALYTDETMKTPAIMTVQEGTVIYPEDSDATDAVRKLMANEAVSVDLSAMDTTGEIVETYADDTTKTTTMEFDEEGNPIRITDSSGHVTTITW